MKLFSVFCRISFSQLIDRRVNIDQNSIEMTGSDSGSSEVEPGLFHIVGRSEFQPDLCFNIPDNLRDKQILLINDPNLGFNATGLIKKTNQLASLNLNRYFTLLKSSLMLI